VAGGPEAPAQGSPASAGWPPARIAWTTIGVLALVRLSAQLDLGILSLLVQPIKTDLGLSDGQIGLLLGFAFASFYLVIGVPLASLVDRRSRRAILGCGVAVWSLMTALCGVAQNFWQLFACRVGVGAGEAVNGPATYSMISDLFPRERLARAIAVINLGSYAGLGLSLVLGAVVIHALSELTMPALPLIGPIRHWQMVFFIVGLPGLLLALWMMLRPEPARRGKPIGAGESVSYAGVFRFLRANWPIFLPMFAAVMLSGIESGGTQMWRPAFFERSYGWKPQQSGLAVGVSQLIAAPLGLFVGIWIVERIARRRNDANLFVCAMAWAIAAPAMIAGPLMPTAWGAVIVGAFGTFFSTMAAPTQNAAIQSVTPNALRGKLTALYLLAYTLAGQGIGPSFIAAITQHLVGDEAGLNYALAGSAAVMMPLAATVMILGMRAYGREIGRLKAEDALAAN
jgi:MFS family permease